MGLGQRCSAACSLQHLKTSFLLWQWEHLCPVLLVRQGLIYRSAGHSHGLHRLSRFLCCSTSFSCCLRNYDTTSVRDNLIKDYTS